MKRTSFVGALIAIALGGVLAFALQSSPRWLDVHAAGLIIMIAGIADLLIRFALGDSPLLKQETADVAAVVEPLGEPILDVFGNPITTANHPTTPMLQAPPLAVPVPYEPGSASADGDGDGTGSSTGVGNPVGTTSARAPDDTQNIPVVEDDRIDDFRAADPMERYSSHDRAVHDQVVRQVGDYEAPDSLAPVSALTGRPVRSRRRRRR